MDDKFNGVRAVAWLTTQIEPYASSSESYGQICADFADLSDACYWFLAQIEAGRSRTLTQDELEDLLVDIDVKFIQHVSFHLKSLRVELNQMLKKFPNEKE